MMRSFAVYGCFLTLTIIQTILVNGISDPLVQALRLMGLAFVYHLFIVGVFYGRKELIAGCVNLTLAIFVGGFLLQFAFYYFTGYYIDLRYLISGAEAKLGDSLVLSALWGLPEGLIRATSFFNEPGTYSSIVIQLLIVSYFAVGRLSALHMVTVLTLFLSLSTFGLILGISFLVYAGVIYLSSDKISFKKRLLVMIIGGFPIAWGILSFAWSYVDGRFISNHKNDGGIGFRQGWLDAWDNADIYEKISGFGVGFYDIDFSHEGNIFIQDIGMWFHTLVSLGYISTLFFIALIIWYSRSFVVAIAVGMLLMSKNVFYGYSIMATLGIIYCLNLTRPFAKLTGSEK